MWYVWTSKANYATGQWEPWILATPAGFDFRIDADTWSQYHRAVGTRHAFTRQPNNPPRHR